MLLLPACAPSPVPSAEDSAPIAVAEDSAVAEDTAPSPVDSGEDPLDGTSPEVPTSLPEFVARAADGTARGPADLVGHPTVLWYFREAGGFG